MTQRYRRHSMPRTRSLAFACLLSICAAPVWAQDVSDLEAPEDEVPVEPTNAATGGKLLLTAGVTQIEGAAGGGLTPWAVIGGYGENNQFGANAF